MNRYAPRHLKQQPGLMARTVPVSGVRASTALATGAALSVPATMGGLAMAGGAAAAAPAAPVTGVKATAVKTGPVKTAPSARVVVLRYASTGSLVRTLQSRLSIPVDGSFGPQTLAAVKSHQRAKGLAVDGFVGPATWVSLGGFPGTSAGNAGGTGGAPSCSSQTVRYGATGGLVRTLQARIGTSVDGSFGPQTLSAVRAYQRSKGLTADGVVSAATWRALGGFPCGTGGNTTGPGTGNNDDDTGSTPPAASPGADYKLPFPAGTSYRITQSPSGLFSHSKIYSKYAIDFAMPTGSTVLVSREGTVYKAGWDSYGGGNSVMVRDATGNCMQYNHLSAINLRAGQRVAQGDVVGRSGSTGNSTGPHLHLEVHLHGQPVDPKPWLRAHGML